MAKSLDDLGTQACAVLRAWFCAELLRGRPVNEIEEDADGELERICAQYTPSDTEETARIFAANSHEIGYKRPDTYASSIFDAIQDVIYGAIERAVRHEIAECIASVESEATYYEHDEPEDQARKWLARSTQVDRTEETTRQVCIDIGNELASDSVGAAYLAYRAMMAMGIA